MKLKFINAALALIAISLAFTFCTKEQQQEVVPSVVDTGVTSDVVGERGPNPCVIQFGVSGGPVTFCGVVSATGCKLCTTNVSTTGITYGPGLHTLTGVTTTNGQITAIPATDIPTNIRLFVNGVLVDYRQDITNCTTINIDGANCTATF
jgi:hypothetical protein